MLAHAAASARARPVQWQPGRRDAAALRRREFDVVVCQFGVMFFPDRAQAFAEARRVLRPGGAFVFNAWDRIEDNEFADVVTSSLATLFPADPPRFMARTPHGYHDRTRSSATCAPAASTTRRADRHGRGAEQRAVGAPSGDRLLPGHAAAQRDRGARSRRASAKRPTSPPPRSRAASAPGRSTRKIQAHIVVVER